MNKTIDIQSQEDLKQKLIDAGTRGAESKLLPELKLLAQELGAAAADKTGKLKLLPKDLTAESFAQGQREAEAANLQYKLKEAGIRGARTTLSRSLKYRADEIGALAAEITLKENPPSDKMGRFAFVVGCHEGSKVNRKESRMQKAVKKSAASDLPENVDGSVYAEPAPLTEDVQNGTRIMSFLESIVPNACSKLTDIQKEVLSRTYWDGLDSKQISDWLKLSPLNKKLSRSGARRSHRAALKKLNRLIVKELAQNPEAVRILSDPQGPWRTVPMAEAIRQVVSVNCFSIRLAADKLVNESLPDTAAAENSANGALTSEAVALWKAMHRPIAVRKEQLIRKIFAGKIDYPTAVESCKTEFGRRVAADFILLLRTRIRGVTASRKLNQELQERLDKVYDQSFDDLHDLRRW